MIIDDVIYYQYLNFNIYLICIMENLIVNQTTDNQTTHIVPAVDPLAVVKKNYKIKRLIGQGAFGSVYKAKKRTTG